MGKLTGTTWNSELPDNKLDEILEKHILVDLRSMNTDPQYNEATMELTGLKTALTQLLLEARIEEAEACLNATDVWVLKRIDELKQRRKK